MDLLLAPETWIALLTLTALEVVLGIDNVIFISILASKLPENQQGKARRVGLAAAMLTRLALLGTLAWIIGLTKPLFALGGFTVSGRDLILIGGGLFLIAKSTSEIHDKLEGQTGHGTAKLVPSFSKVIVQIMLLDIVFSLDSVITAVGMVDHIWVMAAAVVIAVGIMMWSAEPISRFVHRHPSIKMLALSFLLLIGFTLVVEGLHQHIAKAYIYFAMAFSLFVELLNIRVRTKAKPVELVEPYT
jgi:predicted tellurium resistance membrane protein TerC